MEIKIKAYQKYVIYSFIFSLVILPIVSYDVGEPINQEIIWKCQLCNLKSLNNILGENWTNNPFFSEIKQGSVMKWEISSKMTGGTHLNLTVKQWGWQDVGTWSTENEEVSYLYYNEPELYPSNFNFSNNFPYINHWLPLPMSVYVSELELNQIYDVDDRVLFTINVALPEDYISNEIPTRSVNLIAIYNEQGYMSTFKIYLPGNVVLLDISLLELPTHVIPVLIGLFSCMIGFSILYFTKLRRK